jgi:hypothetical protein
MATINTKILCGNCSSDYGWDSARVERLKTFLSARHLYREGVPHNQLRAAMDEFLAAEDSANEKKT